MAEGRGKAQAASLRRTRTEAKAKLVPRPRDRTWREASALTLKPGDLVLVEAGDLIPSDGEVIEGVASVDEVGDHRRIGAGDPRERRRPLGGHRRHAGPLRPDPGADHRRARARPSSTG